MVTTRLVGLVVAAAATVGTGNMLFAQSFGDDVLVVPIDAVFTGPAGSVVPITSWPVPAEFQGAQCEVEVEATNQSSTHPGTDVLVTSGGATVELDDVESVAFGVTTATLPLPLGSSIDVSLRLGPDEIYSGGLLVTIDCPLVGPETTADTIPDTTDSDTTVPGTTDTDTSAPPRGVSAGEEAPSSTLPATGAGDTVWAAIAAIVLLAAGGGLIALARRSH